MGFIAPIFERLKAGIRRPITVAIVNSSGDHVSPTKETGTWSYYAGTSGTVIVSGRVLQITAVALEAAGTITINGGATITLPYGSTDKASTSITIIPKGNLSDPTVVFTGTDGYFIEVVA